MKALVLVVVGLAFFIGKAESKPSPAAEPWVAKVNVTFSDRKMTRGEAELLANRVVVTIMEDEWIANEIENAEVVRVRRRR